MPSVMVEPSTTDRTAASPADCAATAAADRLAVPAGDEHLGLYVGHLQLDAARLCREIAAGLYAPRVQQDVAGAAGSGVRDDGSYKTEPLAAALTAAAAPPSSA
jgi:hypothetical protein